MEYFVTQLINGLAAGSLYALIAVGYNMVYGILQLVNFTHGDVYMFGTFIAMTLLGAKVPFPLAVLIACTAGGLLSLTIEKFAYRPVRNAGSRIVPMISAINLGCQCTEFSPVFAGQTFEGRQFYYQFIASDHFQHIYPFDDQFCNSYRKNKNRESDALCITGYSCSPFSGDSCKPCHSAGLFYRCLYGRYRWDPVCHVLQCRLDRNGDDRYIESMDQRNYRRNGKYLRWLFWWIAFGCRGIFDFRIYFILLA